jgi:hypothetical protein
MKPILFAVAFVSLAALVFCFARAMPARASSNPRIELAAAGSCTDHYNSLLRAAKAALIAGDRATTVKLLEKAERIIPSCPALKDGASPQAALLSLNECDGTHIQESTSSRTCFGENSVTNAREN